jgi:ketosteroid isomerase-like protein
MSDDPQVAKIQEEIRAASVAFGALEMAGEFEKVAQVYASDAVLQAANRPRWEGREAIHQGYIDFFSTVRKLEGEPIKVVAGASGDVAFEYGWNRITLETPEGVVEVPGKYSRGWKKIEGGWKIQLQTYSPDG